MKLSKVLAVLVAGALLPLAAAADNFIVIAKGNKLTQKQIAGIQKAGGVVTRPVAHLGFALVESDAPDFQERVAEVRGIHSAPHNFELQFIDPVAGESISTEALDPPFTGDDDFFFDLQWGHAAINATDAWEKGHRGAGARVAVLDSGIDTDHPDLAPNLNLGLSVSINGEPLDFGDIFSHGTHVAGTIAAADNAFGTIGVAPEAEIVAVKVLSHAGSGSLGDILAGMVYAADIDADIVNMSLGATIPRNCTFVVDPDTGETVHFPAWECASIWVIGNRVANYMRQMGTLVIASAGNSGRDLNHDAAVKEWPNDLPGVVPVSALGPVGWALDPANADLDRLASYSNFGKSGVDFSAPGGDFVYPGNELCFGPVVIVPCWVFDLVMSTGNGGWYWSAGTSMAAPHVAGVAALIVGANGGSMAPSEIVEKLKASSDDLGKPGKDDYYGHGRVNASNAVD